MQELPFISLIDVVVDGRFVEELKDQTLKWRGSSNQRVIDVKKVLEEALETGNAGSRLSDIEL